MSTGTHAHGAYTQMSPNDTHTHVARSDHDWIVKFLLKCKFLKALAVFVVAAYDTQILGHTDLYQYCIRTSTMLVPLLSQWTLVLTVFLAGTNISTNTGTISASALVAVLGTNTVPDWYWC